MAAKLPSAWTNACGVSLRRGSGGGGDFCARLCISLTPLALCKIRKLLIVQKESSENFKYIDRFRPQAPLRCYADSSNAGFDILQTHLSLLYMLFSR